jgi:chromosome segregation ATPase
VYRAEALWDQLPELDAPAVEDVSAVEKVITALVDRDKAVYMAREDLAGARILATEWEAEVASVRAQLQQDRATLEGARDWQSQEDERAKGAEELRTSLANQASSLSTMEEQLQQERVARQQAEAQLQQERTALVEARAALKSERLVREEAQCRLQQERAALEGAQATLKQRDDVVSRLNGELTQLSVSHEDLRQSLEEQETTVLNLLQAAEDTRASLEAERKEVEGGLSFACLLACCFVFLGIRSQFFVFCLWLSGLRVALGNSTTQAQAVQTAYNSSQQELEELRAAALEACQEVEEGEAQAGSSMASRLRALHVGVQKALGVVASHYQVGFEAASSGYVVPVGVEDEVAMNRVDALAATAADMLAEDFKNFLYPDAPAAGGPQA